MSDLPAAFAAASTSINGPKIKLPKHTTDEAAARKTAEEFEATFLSNILGSMFKGIKTDGPFFGGHGEEMYRSLMMEEYGKAIAHNGGIGLADAVMREILDTQEVR